CALVLFFQAEDGIRYPLVTGVQTCALPIFTVRDEGVGIPSEELDGLFQPFHGRFAKGSGLGLAIVHRIVTDYNGEIQVSSQPEHGTTVSVRLPARAVVSTCRLARLKGRPPHALPESSW